MLADLEGNINRNFYLAKTVFWLLWLLMLFLFCLQTWKVIFQHYQLEFYPAKTALLYPNPHDYYITFVIESEKAFKLFLVLRTWHSVVRHEGLFNSRCQKGGQTIFYQTLQILLFFFKPRRQSDKISSLDHWYQKVVIMRCLAMINDHLTL